MNEQMFEIKHRNIATETFLLKLSFEETMAELFIASKELHMGLAQQNVFRGEYIFATPRSLRSSGELIFIKVQMEGETEQGEELTKVSLLSRPRRSIWSLDRRKNRYNIFCFKEWLSDYILLIDEEIEEDEELDH